MDLVFELDVAIDGRTWDKDPSVLKNPSTYSNTQEFGGEGDSCLHDDKFEDMPSHVRASPFHVVPIELIVHILEFVRNIDLRRTRLVSRLFKDVSDSDYIWHAVVRRLIPNYSFEGVDIFETWKAMLPWRNGVLPGAPSKGICALQMRKLHTTLQCLFSKTSCCLGLQVSNFGRTVSSGASVQRWASIAVGYPVMRTGVHYAEFVVDSFREGEIGNKWKIVLGIVSDEFEFETKRWIGRDSRSFGYVANGYRVGPSCPGQGEGYGKPYGVGSKVGILFDANHRKLTFYLDGKSQGIAFCKGSGWGKLEDRDFRFGLCLARSGFQITMTKYQFLGDADCSDYFDPTLSFNND